MNILVACEESQRVTTEFRRLGHNAFSCDIIDQSGGHPEWHIKQDVVPLLNGNCKFTTTDGTEHEINGRWDLIIGHPFKKKTCLWLKGLPELKHTKEIPPEECQSTKIAGNWFNRGGKDRQRNRSKTFPGIAKAMAEQ